MPAIFFTGYPGFLGSELLPRILNRDPELTAHCLVQAKFAPLARERARPYGDRVRIIEGDITKPLDAATDDVVEIYHLAAIYDLSVRRDLGMRVNVDGTRNMLDFAERCASPRLPCGAGFPAGVPDAGFPRSPTSGCTTRGHRLEAGATPERVRMHEPHAGYGYPDASAFSSSVS